MLELEVAELAMDATAVDALANTVEAVVTTLLALAESAASPFSMARSASSPPNDGTKRVHHNATRRPRSTMRCLRMNSTTRTKKASAARITRRSSQSDFSSAVMRCLDVDMSEESTSCVVEVDFNEAVEDSVRAVSGRLEGGRVRGIVYPVAVWRARNARARLA